MGRSKAAVAVCMVLAAACWAHAQPVVGWRTDGTGRYPDADPPITWSAQENVVWKTPMPDWSNATPVVVGDRIFVCSEPADLICVRAADGTLWLDAPSVGGPSPDVPVRIAPAGAALFRHHSVRMQPGPLPWVAASGIEGLSAVTVSLVNGRDTAAAGEQAYTVRLVFAETEGAAPGGRVSDVAIQGREVLKEFDIAAAAGGSFRPVVREFKGIRVQRDLTITLSAVKGKPLLCGIEIRAE